MGDVLAGPVAGQMMGPQYAAAMGQVAYVWGWPLVNMHNRRIIMQKIPAPGLLGGFVPCAPVGRLGMLHDYISSEQRMVACPNQDVVYGFGILDVEHGPCVVQVPDFGDRFWVYQAVDQRTEAFAQLGKMYGSAPGHYLLAPAEWDGAVPEGITGVFRFDTQVAACIPRVFLDDTAADREAIQPIVNQVMMYPLADFDGTMKTIDWRSAPSFPAPADAGGGGQETQWVDPGRYFDELAAVLKEVPARPGEEALYAWFASLTEAAGNDPATAKILREAAATADATVLKELFEFRNIANPVGGGWTTPLNGAEAGGDYLSRTAMAKANIFVNAPAETMYLYQEFDQTGRRLDGGSAYTITFAATGLPPVKGFWSLTAYDQHHFFVDNPIDRYSLGTKNKDLFYGADRSLTLYIQAEPPADESLHPNWLPTPATGPFSLYLRAYWPSQPLLDHTWTPPAIAPADPTDGPTPL